MVWGSLISAGASLAGAFIGAKSDKAATAATIQNAALDRQLQKDFAQQGIGWRVDDAKASGIHPLYAMGANLPTYSPSPISISGSNSWQKGLSDAGQNIGRAVSAAGSKADRLNSLEYKLGIERTTLENDLLRARIATERGSQIGPALPTATNPGIIPGQGDAAINVQPMMVNPSAPGAGNQETGAVADTGFVKTATGLALVPSMDAKERIEDQLGPEVGWAIRNMLIPAFDPKQMNNPDRKPNAQQFPTPPGFEWTWHRMAQEYRITRIPYRPREKFEKTPAYHYPHIPSQNLGTWTGS